MNEVLHQHRNVLFPLPQRGHLERKDVQPVKEILAESPSGRSIDQIAVRGSDDANVDVNGLSSPNALQFPFLQDPQQCYLHVGRQFAHLVEKYRPVVGQFEAAKPLLQGSREGALFVSEQF